MKEAKPAERLLMFTDAVVAIAITLLILPLLDVVTEGAAEHISPREVISGSWPQILSFLLSFGVIARLWIGHHDLFSSVKLMNRSLVWLDLMWLLTIVVLPFPTAIAGAFKSDRFMIGFYIGTMLVSSLCQTAMAMILRANRGFLRDPEVDDVSAFAMASQHNTIAFAIAFALSVFIPGVGFFSLLLLLFVPQVTRLLKKKTA